MFCVFVTIQGKSRQYDTTLQQLEMKLISEAKLHEEVC